MFCLFKQEYLALHRAFVNDPDIDEDVRKFHKQQADMHEKERADAEQMLEFFRTG